jgi:hypothetical protein
LTGLAALALVLSFALMFVIIKPEIFSGLI